MNEQTYYLVFAVDRIPDLTLTKYSVLDGSSVDDIMDKHGVFLRQLHRLGSTSGVYFHLLYYFDPDTRIQKGHHLSVVFYATSTDKRKLEGIREFLTTSVLSTYYDFHCYEVSTEFQPDVIFTSGNTSEQVVSIIDLSSKVEDKYVPEKQYDFAKRLQFENGQLYLFDNEYDDTLRDIYHYEFDTQTKDVLSKCRAKIISWEKTSKNIEEFLRYDQDLCDITLAELHTSKRVTAAHSLWYLYRDLSQHARQIFPSMSKLKGIDFQKETAWLETQLLNLDFFSKIRIEYQDFLRAHEIDNSILRFHYGVIADSGMMFTCYYTEEKQVVKLELRDVQCVINLINTSGEYKTYGIDESDIGYINKCKREISSGIRPALSCEIASDGDAVLSINSLRTQKNGQMFFSRKHVLAEKMHIKDDRLWLYESREENSESGAFCFNIDKELAEALTKKEFKADEGTKFVCYFQNDSDVINEIRDFTVPCDEKGIIIPISNEMEQKFPYAAFLTKKDYYLPAQNRLNTDGAGEVNLYSIMEWEPCEDGRLYNVLKLMEGYNRTVALRIDIFPVEHTQTIRQMLPYAETRRRISERNQGKDDNSENIIKSWDKYLQNLMKFPQFFANVVAFADSKDIAVMLADSVAAEAVESGTYLIEDDFSETGFSVYYGDNSPLNHLDRKAPDNYVAKILSLYTLEEVRPMFSLPILYPGESIECLKETDPKPFQEKDGEAISLGISSLGYDVDFPIKLFKKHAFIAGVPGAGKTNTMLHLVTSLWRDSHEKIPFLVLEPAKQEYRALANIHGMEELRIFSPGADTYFPLHINPFQFPVGLTLAEHIANLNAVFAGAFELPPPSPHFIDTCIEKVYLDKGWNVNERNTLDEKGNYRHEFPTLQELYASLEVAVKNSHYQGETLGNLQSVLEVRVGSLLKREIGNVYNVRESILKPEEWLDVPAIIELEALGEGPANFMSLLLSTLIRETLKVRKTSDTDSKFGKKRKVLNHVIFYEEAHNLIGPDTDSPLGDSVDPKISATKYVVKMLAEVRALGEGIVIADQLPTVMAPEVLKNTGLKIAHRITAQDDRSLLGSTMSASPDQLEEQGVFGTGSALIFYEDLLKPYKMKVHEWDRANRNKDKYESPTNRQLFNVLRDNPTYRETLLQSAKIMKDKMDVEYKQLNLRASKLKENIDTEFLTLRALMRGIENQEAEQLAVHTKEESERLKIDLHKQKIAYEDKKKRFLQKYSRELQQLCWDYSNQYYASITLAKNYDFTANLLYATAISGFLTIFETMRSLVDVPELAEILVNDTSNVMNDLQSFVSLDRNTATILRHDERYNSMVYASGYYWVNEIYLRKTAFVAKAKRIVDLTSDKERNINDFCNDWTQQFSVLYQKADVYADAVDFLIAEKENDARRKYLDNPTAYENLMSQAADLKNKKYAIYKALHSLVIGPIKAAFRHLNGADRICFLKASKTIREQHLEIVNYLDGKANAKLSKSSRYKQFREEATVIANIDLLARIEMAKTDRLLKTEQLISSNNSDDKRKILCWIRDIHNAYFKVYRSYDVERYDYNVILVNFYMQFLDSMMDLGEIALSQLKDNDPFRLELRECSNIIQQLMSQELVPEDQKISWTRVFDRWNQLIKE